jgi:hypothetical protein
MEKMPQARRNGLIVKEVDGEVLIYDRANNKAHCLNSTAAHVWKYCDGNTTVADACSALSRSLGSPVDEKLVWYAVNQFKKDELLEDKVLPPAFISAGINRRQMVRTLGLAAVIAVPLVTTMVAPTPAQAASQTAPGTPCCSSATCLSQICNPPPATPLSCSPINGTCA